MGERRALVAVVAAACPELSLEQIGAALEATITNPAVARSLTAALAAGPEVVRAGAPPVVARLVGELRDRGSTLHVPACATCGRTGRPLIRVGTTGMCPRCRARCARPAIAPRWPGGGRVRDATSSAGWCRLLEPAPGGAVTAPASHHWLDARTAGSRTAPTRTAVACAVHWPSAPPACSAGHGPSLPACITPSCPPASPTPPTTGCGARAGRRSWRRSPPARWPSPMRPSTPTLVPVPPAYVRQMLVAGEVLPARDEALVALEAWVTERVESVGDPEHRRMLRAYATWGVLRRARQRAERAK